ncbi:MAG: phosphoribosylamine--glycine ligase [Desulfovibrio sp.]|nr:phosphoribosylamine--glycine ligase [Desulfovibrio sp.]
MRVLVIGSGGREHALVWKLLQGSQVDTVFVAPGNGGTAGEKGAVNVPVAVDDLDGLVDLARREHVDLVVPGPELPLTLGITDRMAEAGIACFGPDTHCARLEGSKAFAKKLMERAKVPTARCAVFHDAKAAAAHIRTAGAPVVIKADGLAAGKGVVIAQTEEDALHAIEDIMTSRSFGAAGDTVVVEELLEGEEVSLLCLCDGTHALPLPSAQDHKRVFDNDRGPNTGGMGAYSPAPVLPDADLERLADITVRPILRVLAEDGHPFVGVLYAGLMMTPDGPRVLEYNVRFGDPECQPLLMRLEGDLPALMLDAVHGRLPAGTLPHSSRTAVGVVMAAEGYPGSYAKGMTIKGIDTANALPDVKVFHSGTKLKDGALLSSGGRVLCVTALGRDLAEAQARAYDAVKTISMPQSFYRHDIGAKGIRRLSGR